MKIYLAGPMANVSDDDMHGWRDRIKEKLTNFGAASPYEFRDPTRRIYRGGLSPVVRRAIVSNDKVDIHYCDILLANIQDLYKGIVMVGTIQEIIYGYENGKFVIVMTDPKDPLSPWISEHAHCIVHSEEDAVTAVALERDGAVVINGEGDRVRG